VSSEHLPHLFHGAVGVRHRVPVVSVPADYEPHVPRPVQLLLVRLQTTLSEFATVGFEIRKNS